MVFITDLNIYVVVDSADQAAVDRQSECSSKSDFRNWVNLKIQHILKICIYLSYAIIHLYLNRAQSVMIRFSSRIIDICSQRPQCEAIPPNIMALTQGLL